MIHLFYLRSLFFLGIISFVLLLFPSFSSAKINIEELLRKLDSSYYYPQKHGLVNISAKYEWEQQDLTLGKKNYIKKLGFIFNGQFKDGYSIKRIDINDVRVTLSGNEKAQYINTLNNYIDTFIPKTLYEKFSTYHGYIKHSNKKETLIKFQKKYPGNIDGYFELLVDKEKWRLSKLSAGQNHEPKNVKGEFRYSRKEGKWIIEETYLSFIIGDKKYIDKKEYTYRKFGSFWLINKIKQTVRQDGRNIFLYRFRLVDCKINSLN